MADDYFVIPMPLTKDGRGPASPDETVKIVWEIWDCARTCSLSTHETEEEALEALAQLRSTDNG